MVVAYDGTDFNGFAPADPTRRAHRGRRARPRDRQGAAPRRGAHVRGSHRRGRARVGSGRELRVGARARRVAAAVGGQLDARARSGRAFVRDGAAPTSTLATARSGAGTGTRFSIGRCPTRSATASSGGSPSHSTSRALRLAADPFVGRARLLGVLPQGPRRLVADAARARVEVGRRGRRCAALRDLRQRVLLADGARHRRHARGGRDWASADPAR